MKTQAFIRLGALTGLLWPGASLQFKFALANGDRSHGYWNNDGRTDLAACPVRSSQSR